MTRGTLTSLRDSRRFLISLFMITAILGLGTALFSDGLGYGLYVDDYTNKQWNYDLQGGAWQPSWELAVPNRAPIGQLIVLNLANALPDWELPVRLVLAAVHFSNVCLAAFLAYRLVQSPLIAITTGVFLLFPLPAHEAIFWYTAATATLHSALLALVSMHLLLSSVSTDKRWGVYAVLGLAVFALILQFYEQAATCVLVLPLLTLIEKPFSAKRLRRALFIVLLATGLLFLHWFFLLRHTYTLADRGGVGLSLASLWSERLPGVLKGIGYFTFGRYGLSGYRSAWTLGVERALSSSPVLLLVALLGVSLAFVVILASRQNREHSTDVRGPLTLLAVGCLWAGSAFLPILVVKGQAVEPRLLYYPWIGLAFVFSAGIALLMPRLHRRFCYALAVLLGLFFVAALPTMAGFGQVYKLRYKHDQKQLAALVRAAPRLPEGQVTLVPVQMDEGFVPSKVPEHDILEDFLLGVFETDWSAASSASMLYGKSEIQAVTLLRWQGPLLQGMEGEGLDTKLVIGGQSVAADRSLFFSYRRGQVVLHEQAIVNLPCAREARIGLPLARQVVAPDAMIADTPLIMTIEGPLAPEVVATQAFGDLISLTGYSLHGYRLPGLDGQGYALVTRWSCRDSIAADYTLYVHYVDGSGDRLAQDDHLLGRDWADATVPTSQWSCPGSYVDVSYISGDLMEEQELGAAIGLWIPETEERLAPSGEVLVDQYGRVRLTICQ